MYEYLVIDCDMCSEACARLGECGLDMVSGGGVQVVKEGSPGTGL